ncbi:MAG: hypothetical protein ACK4QL_06515 [Pseudanabaenaceae cyanobacterium]
MSPNLVHCFWSAVAKISPQQIRPLDDPSLLQWLLKQIQEKFYLDPQQRQDLASYISDRLPLIRELTCEQP